MITRPFPEINPALLECSWPEFKRMAIEFHNTAPTLSLDELDRSFKNLTLAYFNLKCDEIWKSSAVLVIDMASQDFVQREIELGVIQC